MIKALKKHLYMYLWENNELLLDCIEAYTGRNYPIFLEYPLNPEPRWGHGKPPNKHLYELINAKRNNYADLLKEFRNYAKLLSQIPLEGSEEDNNPYWQNTWFTGMSAVSLFSFLCKYNPENYIEVGSGFSTRFAREAIENMNLKTKITVIDPEPRVSIQDIVDRQISLPLDQLDLSVFTELGKDDILFIDGSHRAFMNSDSTIIFLDVLPALADGVIVHFHDVYLPYDYPPKWVKSFWNEQYFLAAFLLAQGTKLQILLPCFFIDNDPQLSTIFKMDWVSEEVMEIDPNSFWVRMLN